METNFVGYVLHKICFFVFMNVDSEIYKHIELFVGSIGVILSLFFATYLFITRRNQPRANVFLALYLLAFSLRIGKSLFFNYFPIDPVIRNVFLGVLLAVGPSLWFYTRFLFDPESSSSRPKILLHYIPMILFISFCWIIPNDGSVLGSFFYLSLIIHIVIYTLFAIFWLKGQDKIGFSNSKLHMVQWLFYFQIATLATAFVYLLISVEVIPYYLGMAFFFSVTIIFFSIWALRNPYLFRQTTKKYTGSNIGGEEAEFYLQKLNGLLVSEKLFLDPDLKLSKLSKALGISPKQLSQVINQSLNMNYSRYISQFRVEEAKRLLLLPDYAHHKISSIAYDSGFNSISSFNNAFKKLTGMTAIEYRQTDRQG